MNTKLFWKTYWADKERLRFIAIFGLIIAIFLALLCKSIFMVIPFCLGYICQDPFTYYWVSYRKNKA